MSSFSMRDASGFPKYFLADGAGTEGDPFIGVMRATALQQIIQVVPTITAGAYNVDRVIGGVQQFAAAFRAGGTKSTLMEFEIACKAAVQPVIDLFLMREMPDGTYTDTVAPAPSDADMARLLSVVTVSEWKSFGSAKGVAQAKSLFRGIVGTGTALFVVPVIRTAVTFASASDLIITAKVLQS